jgi:hypothetical protein
MASRLGPTQDRVGISGVQTSGSNTGCTVIILGLL